MIKIKNVNVRKILNSVGKETFEIELITESNLKGISSSPKAILPGRRELLTKDRMDEVIFNKMINEILSQEIENQKNFDEILKKYMESLGTNICLPFSLCFARVLAKAQNITLTQYISNLSGNRCERESPIPLVAIFSGGVHDLSEKGSIQNVMIAVNVHPFSKAVPVITEIYSDIEEELKKKNRLKAYGQSSGMIAQGLTIEEKFDMVTRVIQTLKYEKEVTIAIDVAAEHFFENGIYTYQDKKVASDEWYEMLNYYIEKYPITYVEDPFDSDDKEYWKKITSEHKMLDIIGDDLFATQNRYIDEELAGGMILKMNQVGTLSDTIEAYQKANEQNMITCVSQRSIETEDTFMCDLAVALSTKYVKIGGPRRGDRIAKYNRLLRLEE